MSYTGPKVKISRKLGINITSKAKKITGGSAVGANAKAGKNYPPGQHGPTKKRGKMSDYGKQLLEKQRLRLQYNISEAQMSNYYSKAAHMTGNTGDLYVQLLETRLDALVYRAGFARSIYSARQYVVHGHILVNGKRVDRPSYHVKPNDVLSVKEKSRALEPINESWRNTTPPPYIEQSRADFSAKLVYVPHVEEVPVQVEIPLVVEFYSR